jgi:hypothetical protein
MHAGTHCYQNWSIHISILYGTVEDIIGNSKKGKWDDQINSKQFSLKFMSLLIVKYGQHFIQKKYPDPIPVIITNINRI